ncbi:MAG: hypothetical protein AAFR31_17670 [Cyanobacteria bacterium J06627_8]
MSLQEYLNQQRVKHIVDSYQIDGDDTDRFSRYLTDLLQTYPAPLIELAITETLVDGWAAVPMIRGIDFLKKSHDKLKDWELNPIVSTVTPEQFQHVTGLDPAPVFGTADLPPSRPIAQPS